MSENVTSFTNPQKSRTKILMAGLAVMLLLLVYGAGIMVLPMSIAYSYQNKNCETVFSLNKLYTGIYPGFVQDETLREPVNECTAYTAAISNEEKGNWQDAYEAYQAYSNTYPNGLYGVEIHEHNAIVLMALLKDQTAQKSYEEALTNLNLIISSYSDTSVSTEAWNLFPSTYTSWGTDLRNSGDFEKAEKVFNDFNTWSQDNQKAELALDARNELAQTYIAWGQGLQSQKQWSEALAKLELAVALDPNATQLKSGSTAQAKAGQVSVYIEWGQELVEHKDFAGAIEKFEKAVSLSDASNEDESKEALVMGRIQWASDLSTSEDFEAALEQLEFARNSAATDSMKQAVDAAFEETYLVFSNSMGSQARRAMREALIAACKQHKEPELPIFGLNKDSVRVGVYGIDDQLPENLAAKTPGEMHYIACIEVGNQAVESRYHRYIVQRTSRGYYYMIIQQFRAQLLWDINLLETNTLKSVAKKSLLGGTPPPFPEGNVDTIYFHGSPPTIADLAEWLKSVIK